MIRRFDLLFLTLVLAMSGLVLAAVWPRGSQRVFPSVEITGAAIISPAAGDWVADLAGRLERRDRPERVVEPEQDPFAGYELIGLVETGEAQWALIAGQDESHTLELGDELNGFELVQILADRVVFAQDGDQVVLELRR